MSTHTLGPWKITATMRNKKLGQDESFISSDRPYPNGACVAIVREGELFGELEGNARLIAASPELKCMLQRLNEKVKQINGIQHSGGQVEAEYWSELYQLSNEVDAVLAKAEGRG